MLLQWFGEQSEAVKLAMIGVVSAVGAGVFGVLKEWRKPVLTAAPPASTGKTIDPDEMIAHAVEGISVHLATITKLLNEGADRDKVSVALLEKLLVEVRDVREEIRLVHTVMSARHN